MAAPSGESGGEESSPGPEDVFGFAQGIDRGVLQAWLSDQVGRSNYDPPSGAESETVVLPPTDSEPASPLAGSELVPCAAYEPALLTAGGVLLQSPSAEDGEVVPEQPVSFVGSRLPDAPTMSTCRLEAGVFAHVDSGERALPQPELGELCGGSAVGHSHCGLPSREEAAPVVCPVTQQSSGVDDEPIYDWAVSLEAESSVMDSSFDSRGSEEQADHSAGAAECESGLSAGELQRELGDFGKVLLPPEPFDMEGYRSFRSFLRSYERYFGATYVSSEAAMAAQLGDLLTGRMRHAYDTLIRYIPRYTDLKAKLLFFAKSVRVSHRERAEADFYALRMGDSHSVLLHCIQLEELAKKAFGSAYDCHLWHRVCRTVPDDLHEELRRRFALAAMDGQALRSSWEALLSLAGSYDRSHWRAYEQDDSTGSEYSTDLFVTPEHTLLSTSAGSTGPFRRRTRRRTRTFWATRFHRH